ncbi:hypothetical protein AX14_007061, partial [Amanita brunnescens Koide BX004]
AMSGRLAIARNINDPTEEAYSSHKGVQSNMLYFVNRLLMYWVWLSFSRPLVQSRSTSIPIIFQGLILRTSQDLYMIFGFTDICARISKRPRPFKLTSNFLFHSRHPASITHRQTYPEVNLPRCLLPPD